MKKSKAAKARIRGRISIAVRTDGSWDLELSGILADSRIRAALLQRMYNERHAGDATPLPANVVPLRWLR